MANTTTINEFFTPAEVAARLRIKKLDVIYAHIRAGRLAALNVSPSAGRPCWRISREALDEFIAAQTTSPAPTAPRRARVPRKPVTRYF